MAHATVSFLGSEASHTVSRAIRPAGNCDRLKNPGPTSPDSADLTREIQMELDVRPHDRARTWITELTPLSFLERSSTVFAEKTAVVHGDQVLDLPAARR